MTFKATSKLIASDISEKDIRSLYDCVQLGNNSLLLNVNRTRWEPSLSTILGDNVLYVPTPPSGGVLTALILNILNGYNFTADSIASENGRILSAHRTVEAFKYGN